MAFPAVHVEEPEQARGWYFDGGTRLNTPIKPALKLEAQRLIVIGLNSVSPAPKSRKRPDLFDGSSQIVQGLLVDPVINDVETLATINETLIRGGTSTDREDQPKVIPYIFIAPKTPNRIGQIAGEVYREHYDGLRGIRRSRDLALLGRLIGPARGSTRGTASRGVRLARRVSRRLDAWLGRRRPAKRMEGSHRGSDAVNTFGQNLHRSFP